MELRRVRAGHAVPDPHCDPVMEPWICPECQFKAPRQTFHICAPVPEQAPTPEIQKAAAAKTRNDYKRQAYRPASELTQAELEHRRSIDRTAHRRRRLKRGPLIRFCIIEGCENRSSKQGARCPDCQAKRNTRAIRTRKSVA